MADRRLPQNAHAADPNDEVSNPSPSPTLADILRATVTRRQVLRSVAAIAAGSMAARLVGRSAAAAAGSQSTLTFREVAHGLDEASHVADAYEAQVLLRWGDPVKKGAPPFDPQHQTAQAQAQQFGYNCDFVAFLPLPLGSNSSQDGLLCVNHEYTNAELMFPGVERKERAAQVTAAQVEVELAAHGHSIVAIRRDGGKWKVAADSPFNRRITMTTPMEVSGPAAGHKRLKTAGDPTGLLVHGTLNNCAGGVTPWGTVLIAEENFDLYFEGAIADKDCVAIHKRYRVGVRKEGEKPFYGWSRFHERFDLAKTPHEPFRFGWIVEYDPYDPNFRPKKRTALGRFKHEGATTVVNPDSRVVVYSGDDQANEYLYKFVTQGKYDPSDRKKNFDLLDEGTLYVAQFHANDTLRWLPLTFGAGPLTPENGFYSQANVVIEARRAADLLKATPLDRPEDVETNPVTGRVYAILTNNEKRKEIATASPRAPNLFGHILELAPPDGDHAAEVYRWDVFLMAGDPRNEQHRAMYHPGVSSDGWFASPDNCAFDRFGRMWIATDGSPKAVKRADGIYGCDTQGEGRALTRLFFRAPVGAECCGPCFTPDGETFFVAVQHPGEGDKSTFDDPSTRWPDNLPHMPPRPTVVAIMRKGGGPIGG